MTTSLWWRAENSSIDHPKLLKLSDAMHRAWYTLMCVASANDGALPPTEDIAARLRMNKVKVAEWITKLVAAELFDNVDGVFVPHNWNRRQYKSDASDPTAAERMRRHRKKRRITVTPDDDRNYRNGAVTALPPEANTETDSKQSTAEPRVLDEIGLRNEIALCAQFTALCKSLYRDPPDLRPVKVWLLDGIAIGTIAGAVTPILKRKDDMVSLSYCDAAVREAHARAAPVAVTVPQEPFVLIVEGTPEAAAHIQFHRENGLRPPFFCRQLIDGVEVIAARAKTPFPPGYDEATGEKLAPNSNDEAAA